MKWIVKFGVLACCMALYYTGHPTLALAVALIAFCFAVDAAFEVATATSPPA